MLWEGGIQQHSKFGQICGFWLRRDDTCTDIKMTFFGREDAVLRAKFPLFSEVAWEPKN